MNTSTKKNQSSRRNFLKSSGLAAASLFIPYYPVFAQEQISEAEAIHRIISNPFFRFPKFPIVGASVNMQQSRFDSIETIEYQQQNGWSMIDDRKKLCDLANQVSQVYTPGAVNPNAFDQIVVSSGLPREFAQSLKNNQNPSALDILTQFSSAYQIFREKYGTEWIIYPDQQGRLKITGSEDSIVDIKSDGDIKRPREEARPLRDLLESIGGLFSGKGFKSAEYTGADVNRIPARAINYMGMTSQMQLPFQPARRYTPGVSLSLKDTVSTVVKYGNFPPHKMDIYWLSRENGNMEVRDLNVSGPVNGNAFEIAKLEERLSAVCIDRRRRLAIGSPNKNMISPVSAGNQLSTTSGLLGVDSYSPVPSNNFFIHVMEKTGVSGNLRNYGTHHVTVAFGQDALRMVKMRRDRLFFLGALENAGIGFAFGGPWGAIMGGAKSLFDGVWGYFEGKNPPKSTLMSDNRHYVSGLEGVSRDVYSIINNSHELGANTLIVADYRNDFCVTKQPAYQEPVVRQVVIERPGYVPTSRGNMFFCEPGTYNIPQPCAPAACTPAECIPQACAPVCQPVQTIETRTEWIQHPAEYQYYSVPSVGVLYARDAFNVQMRGNCVSFDTTQCGANHILGLIYGGLMTASVNNPFKHHHGGGPSPGGVTGGRPNAPMGDGFHGVTGGNPGAPTGNGYHSGVMGGSPSGAMGNGNYNGVMGGR